MSMMGYVSPEQLQKDKADFARKGIARGRSLLALSCSDGILLCAENRSRNLHKVAEIYDRIGFAAVGKYDEFDRLRQAGIRHADLKGYQFSREDVDARSLANAFAQTMGQVFTHELKPLEVELLIAEVGVTPGEDQLFRILYDGIVLDETGGSVLGGDAGAIAERLGDLDVSDTTVAGSLAKAVEALAGPGRTLRAVDLEVAVLDRNGERRAFRRLADDEVTELLPAEGMDAAQTDPNPPSSTPSRSDVGTGVAGPHTEGEEHGPVG